MLKEYPRPFAQQAASALEVRIFIVAVVDLPKPLMLQIVVVALMRGFYLSNWLLPARAG